MQSQIQIQPAVKKETLRILWSTIAGCCVMFLAFGILHRFLPEQIPFDYRVFLGGFLGGAVAVGNFFFMGLTVQKVTAAEKEEQAYSALRISYRYRTLVQLLWVILAMVLPFVNGAAGIIPLFFPSITIKLLGILGMIGQ